MSSFVQSTKRQVMKERPRTTLTILLAILISLSVVNLGIGASQISPWDIVTSLMGIGDANLASIILKFRMPRIALAILTGAGLGISGVIVQSIMKNPLAAPDTLGISSGAGLAAIIVTLLIPASSPELLSISAFLGGAVVAAAVYLLAFRNGVEPMRLALVGIAVSAFCSSGIHFIVSKANPNVNSALIWLNGSLWGRTWDQVLELLPWTVFLAPLSWIMAVKMDLIHLGDTVAAGLGVRVQMIRLLLLCFAVGMTGASVAAVGTLGFVGLVCPHIARKIIGAKHRLLIPVSGIIGAIFVLTADAIGRGLIPPVEIPAGLIVAMIGVPYFIYLMWRESRSK